MKNIKEEKGITLIALVITIIVLLILAGVAISMLSGENGILTRASDAKTNTENASIEEQVKLAVTDAMLQSSNYATVESISELEGALTRHGITDATVTGDAKNGYTVTTKEGKEYKVYSNGTIKEKSIMTEITEENYGDVITGYTVLEGDYKVEDWKIFLKDDDGVWIMASDYVKLDPDTANLDGVKMTTSGYNAWWDSAPSNGETYANGNCAKALSKTENWTRYVDTNLATKAMGGATIEMFAKSYNAKYPSKTIVYTNTDTDYNGYKVKWSTNADYDYGIGGLENDGFYCLSSQSKAEGYWLASPSTDGASWTMNVWSYYGQVGCNFSSVMEQRCASRSLSKV